MSNSIDGHASDSHSSTPSPPDTSHQSQPQIRKMLLQAWVAGLLGIISGGLLFYFWLRSHDSAMEFVFGLTGAGVMAFVIEWFREIILHGQGELEEKPKLLPAAVLTFLMLVMLEVFVMASDHTVKMDVSVYGNSLRVLLGEDFAPNLRPEFGLAGLALIWVAMGITVVQGLSAIILAMGTPKYKSRPVLFGLLRGILSALMCVPAMLAALVGFRLFVILSDQGAAASALGYINQLTNIAWVNTLFGIVVLPIDLLQRAWHAVFSGLGSWEVVPAAVIIVVALVRVLTLIGQLTGLPSGTSVLGASETATQTGDARIWWGMTGLLVVLLLPLLLIKPWQAGELICITVVYWLPPCMVLGAVVPLLKGLVRPPSARVAVALSVAGLVLMAVYVVQKQPWFLLVGLMLLLAGLIGLGLGRRSEQSNDFWPVLPAIMAVLACCATGTAQLASRSMLGDMHTLMSVDPLVPKATGKPAAKVTDPPLRTVEASLLADPNQEAYSQADQIQKRLTRALCEAKELTSKQIAEIRAVIRKRIGKRADGEDDSPTEHEKGCEDKPHGQVHSLADVMFDVSQLERLDAELKQLHQQSKAVLERALPEPANGDETFHLALLRTQSDLRMQIPELEASASTVESYINESKEEVRDLRREMARMLELCLSGSFAFWASLACLAGWERMTPRHSAH